MEEKKQNWWTRKTKWGKTSFILSVAVTLLAVAGLIIIAFSRQIFGDEAGDKILGKDIPNGFYLMWQGMIKNSLAWVGTLFTIVLCFVLVFVINGLVGLFTKGNRKSRTIGSLIKSLVKYVAIIAGVGIILSLWGVDVAGIVAGVGVLTLIIGLGCQTLIQDVISGLFIVFDDYFQVGDTVIIDGFRGTITEVGLKTTKLVDYSGNIKSISNSSITTVTNVTRLESMPIITIRVALEEDVERTEAIINEALPKIKESIPQITKGPWYKGIGGFDQDGIQLVFACNCLEDDRFQVVRDLHRELLLLLKRNDIAIPYKQIAINKQETNRNHSANDEQKKKAKEVNDELRGIGVSKTKKKKTFIEKAKESFNESNPLADLNDTD